MLGYATVLRALALLAVPEAQALFVRYGPRGSFPVRAGVARCCAPPRDLDGICDEGLKLRAIQPTPVP